ncbi:putative membrane-associated kinase regulator 6 [Citrus sinensis]|uniref:Membrane-associated kinase regulator 6 n=1 Tax=Citrus sinensis TaxID=2711 RepID=A0ACB8HRU8_CITSI|nr:putative membrane-associated kinase regulator 6 [Citrus sinensis]
METSHSQPLSIESFSYSWLVNLKPSLESLDSSLRASLDACDEASFIEMDPRLPPSKRFIRNSQDFKFDFPVSQSPLALVHADELFSNGYVMPLFVDQMKMEAFDAPDSALPLPSSLHGSKLVVQGKTSPRTSVAYSVDDNWRKSCDSDSSIYEAVLHCKRSIGK